MARKNVIFDLGYVPSEAGLASRTLTITRMKKAGDDGTIAASYSTALGGTVNSVTVALKDNQIWQAVLVDTKTTGEVAKRQVLSFQTADLQFPGPRTEGTLRIYAMEDLSSSSDSSINSSSSSVSSSSVSSVSSVSSSSSSISTSSVSSSSISTSSVSSASSSSSSISTSSASSTSSDSNSSSSS